MAKILLIENTGKVRQVFLEINEACPIDNCGYDQDCAGKKNNRDNIFTCNLRELILLYKKAPKKIIK